MTEAIAFPPGQKLYHVNACTSDGDSLDMNVFANGHVDALDRVIEYWARDYFGRKQGAITRSEISDEEWDCGGICSRGQEEVLVWEVRLSHPDPVTGCILWDSADGGVECIQPDVIASRARRKQVSLRAVQDHRE